MSEKGFGSCGCHKKFADGVEKIDNQITGKPKGKEETEEEYLRRRNFLLMV
jgi:hypothetical protein